ncbi:BEL1-like homeodomain-containing protein [Cinnamomum micranthum f. kanehirae]|uniref:BEL1-like homeodomain-containing protein n=1 Tax=Cinnamomum micranthum f. kanehirae TaxID=337451 RepID=A0A3S3NNW1_9MAGN|nr:BEL1-like homeodomain-containing protein [Cinnamomum micranthum f. kanehirae]
MNERFETGCLYPTTGFEENSVLGMNSFRPDSHVAQQSRRDKLRVQQAQTPTHPNHLLHSTAGESVVDPDPVNQVRSIRNLNRLVYDPEAMFSSEMLNFSSAAHVLLAHKDVVSHQELSSGRLVASDVDAPFASDPSPHPVSCSFNTPAKVCDPHNSSYWKDLTSQQHHGCDWVMNCVSGSGSNACNQNPLSVGGIVSSPLIKVGNISSSSPYLRSGYIGFQNAPSTLNAPSSEVSSHDAGRQYEDMSIGSTSFYHNNAFQEVVTTSSPSMGGSQVIGMDSLVQQDVRGAEHGAWVDGGNELVLLPSFGTPTTSLQLNNAATPTTVGAAWIQRSVESDHQWNGGDFLSDRTQGGLAAVANDNSIQGLSLSLSSHTANELQAAQYQEKFGSQELPSRPGILNSTQSLKANNLGYYYPVSKSLMGNKGYGESVQGAVSSSMDARRVVGPLGPFTGYATILKSSKFLKPAQQLLDEFCNANGQKLAKSSETSEKSSIDLSASNEAVNVESEVGGRSGTTVVSASSFFSSTDACGEGPNVRESCQPYHPDFQRRKARLLFMQEEVCSRYKQYHQQMQMVISSFESVAGLSAATPYTSLALKAVSKHFRCLKHAISDQLLRIGKALGEELMSAGTSKGEIMPRLKFIDQGFRKQKTSESLSFLDQHQQHIWRPQRGLPERAVSILRAWLFEHFLHPYPTDTDKHMLATQTGLSRNQVSNWFINARVRLWKPMVEEIHMLETKGTAGVDLNSVKNDRRAFADNGDVDIQTNNAVSDKQSECSTAYPVINTEGRQNPELWHLDKRTRVDEYQIPSTVDGGLIGFVPYCGGMENVGLGAVSLTLGLRHSAEQQHHQQPLRMHFGGRMVHDLI